ncbi:hypothetical protein L7F22_067389 [Adiantum nelumboides]|nr:hypothetical protein [Adiantum nelumboides]
MPPCIRASTHAPAPIATLVQSILACSLSGALYQACHAFAAPNRAMDDAPCQTSTCWLTEPCALLDATTLKVPTTPLHTLPDAGDAYLRTPIVFKLAHAPQTMCHQPATLASSRCNSLAAPSLALLASVSCACGHEGYGTGLLLGQTSQFVALMAHLSATIVHKNVWQSTPTCHTTLSYPQKSKVL